MGLAVYLIPGLAIIVASLAVSIVFHFDKDESFNPVEEHYPYERLEERYPNNSWLTKRTMDPDIDQEIELERFFKEVEDAQ